MEAELNSTSTELIDLKLNKLNNYIITLKESIKENKDNKDNKDNKNYNDIPYIASLIKDLKDSVNLNNIDIKALQTLKKAIFNIDV